MQRTNVKTALITGGNGDMGRETAIGLAASGYRIMLAGRSPERCAEAAKRILSSVPGAAVDTLSLDLADLSSVRNCAAQLRGQLSSIDALILNAGVMAPPWQRTADGYELQFQANYLGHFLLWMLLAPLVLASEGKKVISISSLSGEKGADRSVIDFERDARIGPEDYVPMKSYRESKLAQMLFTRALRDRYAGQGLKAWAVHPGVVNTGLFYAGRPAWYRALMQPLAWIGYLSGFIVTPRRGARTAIALATGRTEGDSPYWAAMKPRSWNPIADDGGLATALWDWSVKAVAPWL